MLRALRSPNTILTDEMEKIRRGDQSILSRKSDEAWRDHGHHQRPDTRPHIAPGTQKADICVHSSVPARRVPARSTNGFPALLHEGHFWEPSLRAPDSAVLRP